MVYIYIHIYGINIWDMYIWDIYMGYIYIYGIHCADITTGITDILLRGNIPVALRRRPWHQASHLGTSTANITSSNVPVILVVIYLSRFDAAFAIRHRFGSSTAYGENGGLRGVQDGDKLGNVVHS